MRAYKYVGINYAPYIITQCDDNKFFQKYPVMIFDVSPHPDRGILLKSLSTVDTAHPM